MNNQNSRGVYPKDRIPTISRKMAIFGAIAALAISTVPSSAVLAQATGTDGTSTSGTGTSENSGSSNSGRRSLFQQIIDAASRRSEEGNGRNNRGDDRDDRESRSTSSGSTSTPATTSRATSTRATSTAATTTRATSSRATSTAATSTATSTRATTTATTSTSTRPVPGTATPTRPSGTAGGTFTPVIDLRSPGTFTGTLQGLLNPAYADQRKLDPETTNSLLTLSVFLLLSGLGLATGFFERSVRRITGTTLSNDRTMSPEMETRVNVNPYPES